MESGKVNETLTATNTTVLPSSKSDVSSLKLADQSSAAAVTDNSSIKTNIDILEDILNSSTNPIVRTEIAENKLLDDPNSHLYSTIEALKRQLQAERATFHTQVTDLKFQYKELSAMHESASQEKKELRSKVAISLGKNAELNVRSKILKEQQKNREGDVKSLQDESKSAVKKISVREEKIRKLNEEKQQLKVEISQLKRHYVDEKLDKADLYRDQELAKKRLDVVTSDFKQQLEERHAVNKKLRRCVLELEAQLSVEQETLNRVKVEKKRERDSMILVIERLQQEQKKRRSAWELKAKKKTSAAIESLKGENGILVQRYMNENQMLRQQVSRLEAQIVTLNTDLTPAEKARRRLEESTQVEVRSSTADFIALKAKNAELEALLKHSKSQHEEYKTILQKAEASLEASVEEKNIRLLQDLSAVSRTALPEKNSMPSSSPSRKGKNIKARVVEHDKNPKPPGGVSDVTKLKIDNSKLEEEIQTLREMIVTSHDEVATLNESIKESLTLVTPTVAVDDSLERAESQLQCCIKRLVKMVELYQGKQASATTAVSSSSSSKPPVKEDVMPASSLPKPCIVESTAPVKTTTPSDPPKVIESTKSPVKPKQKKAPKVLCKKGVKLEACGTYVVATVTRASDGSILNISAYASENPSMVYEMKLKTCIVNEIKGSGKNFDPFLQGLRIENNELQYFKQQQVIESSLDKCSPGVLSYWIDPKGYSTIKLMFTTTRNSDATPITYLGLVREEEKGFHVCVNRHREKGSVRSFSSSSLVDLTIHHCQVAIISPSNSTTVTDDCSSTTILIAEMKHSDREALCEALCRWGIKEAAIKDRLRSGVLR